MIIPIRTDYRMAHRPWVNYLIIAANVAVYVAGYNGAQHHLAIAEAGLLQPDTPQVYQFFTCMFMHAGWVHLLGNMVFLWVFGNAVNDRFGHIGYLAFYLAGGVLAGVGYLLLSGTAPVLGASGAISAVTGAYLVLLPRAKVTLLVFLIYLILPIEISSLYFIGFQFVWNVVMSLNEGITHMPGAASGGVAYAAHSSGYLFGLVVGVIVLAGRLVPSDKFDMLNLLKSARRRSDYRRMVNEGYDPFGYSGTRGPASTSGRHIPTRTVESATSDTQAAKELQLRREISEAAAAHDLDTAARKYLQLLQSAPDAVLARQQQLDVANQLMATENYQAAADAYEAFLKHYGNYEHVADIYLMLGLIYGRYLHEPAVAREYLQRAVNTLTDPRKLELARKDLQALEQDAGD
jgi:membrane associated rhomboid family serine protease